MASKPAPELGAFTTPVTFQTTQGGVVYEFKSASITLTPAGSEKIRSLSGVGSFLPVGQGPIPPPLPQLTAIVVEPARIPASGSTTLLIAVGPVVEGSPGVKVNLSYSPALVAGPAEVDLPPGIATKGVVLQGQGTPGQVVITARLGAVSLTASLGLEGSVPIPPIPPNRVNVKDHGVKGDGVTNDVTALNALINSAAPGATLYFPAATYFLGDALKVFRPNIGFEGDGDASILKVQSSSYHVQLGSGQPFTGFSFRRLQFLGLPGKYMQDGTCKGGILNYGSKGTVFEDCLFTGCSDPVYNAGAAGSTYGTVVKDCRINGWGRVAIFCNGGERVSGCRLIQDDPNLLGERSSHGFYIHGGANDVEIADTEIANARKYALQVYSEQAGTKTVGVRLLRLNVHDCANGLIFAHSQMGAGDISDAVIEGCRITEIYAGSSIAIKDGQGVKISNNTVDGNTGNLNGHSASGLYCGVWAPYEPKFSLKDILVQGNIIQNCQYGIWTLPSNGGTFTNIQINGNHVVNNAQNYNITGPGVVMTPGGGRELVSSEGPHAAAQDCRPSDDHGELPWEH